MTVTIRNVESTMEKRIITGLITSDELLKQLVDTINPEYFKSSYIRKLCYWILEFYTKYEKAPFEDITNILNVKERELKDGEYELVEEVLKEASVQYKHIQSMNVDYLADQALEFFNTRELEIITGNVQYYLSKGQLEKAQEQLALYKKATKNLTKWENPLEADKVHEAFAASERDFFRLPGKMGELIGNMKPGWLVGISGKFKGGKTWLMIDFAIMAMTSQLPTVFVSQEMSALEIRERIYKRLTAFGDHAGQFIYPAFDCWYNQTGECTRRERVNRITLITGEEPPPFTPDNPYRICTHCRENNPRLYKRALWYVLHERPEYERFNVADIMESFNRLYGDYIRVRAYPRFSASMGDIERDLDILEFSEGFVAKVGLFDYADIFKGDNEHLTGVDKEDNVWIHMAQTAAKRRMLAITGTQLTKEGQDAMKQAIKHQARWIGKLAHVDMFLMLDQTDKEMRQGISRLSVGMHRHAKFDRDRQLWLLQNYSLGQPVLDAEF
jgi:hypothetical protein